MQFQDCKCNRNSTSTINNQSGEFDCMFELQTQLISIVITKATIEQIVELIIPMIH